MKLQKCFYTHEPKITLNMNAQSVCLSGHLQQWNTSRLQAACPGVDSDGRGVGGVKAVFFIPIPVKHKWYFDKDLI